MKTPSKFLFHPKVTIAAVAAALTSLGGSCVAFVAALQPLLKFDFLKPLIPAITRIDGDLVATGGLLLAVAGICTAIAGAGRSFIQAVDNPAT